jgi:hypothetical protein
MGGEEGFGKARHVVSVVCNDTSKEMYLLNAKAWRSL